MAKQYRKLSSKSSKSRKNKTHSKSKQNNRRARRSLNNMKGGDDGRFAMPPSYFGNGTSGYYAAGSPELFQDNKQFSVSQGTVWEGGQYAGPNLYPMQGGNCGCGSKKNQKFKNKSRKTKSKSRKH